MSNWLKLTISILVLLAHFVVLAVFGISFITTSILFYICFYLGIKWIVSKTSLVDQAKINLKNKAKVFITALTVIEILLFLVPWIQTPTEKQYGLYVSTYKYPKIERLTKKYFNKDFRIMYEHGYQPNSEGHYKSKFSFDIHTKYNHLGYRGKLPAKSKSEQEIRVSILGDSYVEGHGVEDSLTMPYTLSQILHNNRDSVKYTVINGGLNGSDPVSIFKNYNKKLVDYKSDIIILVINFSDLVDIKDRGSADYRYKNDEINYKPMPLSEYFAATIRIYRLFHFISRKMISQNFNKEIDVILDTCEKFQNTLKQEEKFYLCYLPIKRSLNNENKIMQQLDDKFSNSSLNYYNLNARYEQEGVYNKENYFDYFWKTDSHHTPKGYEFMAKVIAEELILSN